MIEVFLIGGAVVLVTWTIASFTKKEKARRVGKPPAGPRALGPLVQTPAGPVVPAPEIVQAVNDVRQGTATSPQLAQAAQAAADQGLAETSQALSDQAQAVSEREAGLAPGPTPEGEALPVVTIEWEGRTYTVAEFLAYLNSLQPADVFSREGGGVEFLLALGGRLRTVPGMVEDHPLAVAFRSMLLRYLRGISPASVQAMPEAGVSFLDALGRRVVSEVAGTEDDPIANAYRTLISQWLDLIGQRLAVIGSLSDADLARLLLLARGVGLGGHATAMYIESIIVARQQAAAAAPPAEPVAPPPARTWEWRGQSYTAAQWRAALNLIAERRVQESLRPLPDADLTSFVAISREIGAGDHEVVAWIEGVLASRAAAVVPAGLTPAPAPAPAPAGPAGYDPERAKLTAPVLDRELRKLGSDQPSTAWNRNSRSMGQTAATLSALEQFSRAAFGNAQTDAEIARNRHVSYGGGMRGALIYYGISNPPLPIVAPLATRTYVPPTGVVA